MKKTLLNIALLFAFTLVVCQAQNTMRVHQNNGTVISYGIAVIDSMAFGGGTPPTQLSIFFVGGGDVPLTISGVDSITYTNTNFVLPTVVTRSPMFNIFATSADAGGSFSSQGGSAVTARGICWSVNPNPTILDNIALNYEGDVQLRGLMTGLQPSTTYYVRAFARNSGGVGYGAQVSFTTLASGDISSVTGAGVTDIDGNTYATIVLGNGQEWMRENLRTDKFNNGDEIPNVQANNQWTALATPAWCHHSNLAANDDIYGKLYNGFVVADDRNVCPSGWRVPTIADWDALNAYLDPSIANPIKALVAGGKMKSSGNEYWSGFNNNATNQSGFSARGGGSRGSGGSFAGFREYANFWTGTPGASPNFQNVRGLRNINIDLNGFSSDKRFGYSVRCVKN